MIDFILPHLVPLLLFAPDPLGPPLCRVDSRPPPVFLIIRRPAILQPRQKVFWPRRVLCVERREKRQDPVERESLGTEEALRDLLSATHSQADWHGRCRLTLPIRMRPYPARLLPPPRRRLPSAPMRPNSL